MMTGAVLCAMAAQPPKRSSDYLATARILCGQIGNVWFTTDARYMPSLRCSVTVYRLYRKGTGFIGERSTARGLVQLLKKQLPVRSA